MDRLDRILELVDDLTADQVYSLIDVLVDNLDDERFERLRQRFFREDESAPPS